jgi:hypothetical protein
MNPHINSDGKFQSDKYPTCPAGKVPLSTKDPMAQDILWTYAQRRREIDEQFSEAVEICLQTDGFERPATPSPPNADREAWLLHPVSSAGRLKIDAGQYEELRELAVRLRNELDAGRIPPAMAPACTGSIVHDEYTSCPVHDRRR